MQENKPFLVVGLGNPGGEYSHTRHNVGFMAIDKFVGKDAQWKNEKNAQTTRLDVNGNKVIFVKPQTFMNNSGLAVGALMAFYKIPLEKVIVVYDDTTLDVGKMRIRKKGSAGGHNGIKSIIAQLGSENFPRVKIGVGSKPHKDADLADWVLSGFSPAEQQALDFALDNAANAALCILEKGIYEAANRYNGSHP